MQRRVTAGDGRDWSGTVDGVGEESCMCVTACEVALCVGFRGT